MFILRKTGRNHLSYYHRVALNCLGNKFLFVKNRKSFLEAVFFLLCMYILLRLADIRLTVWCFVSKSLSGKTLKDRANIPVWSWIKSKPKQKQDQTRARINNLWFSRIKLYYKGLHNDRGTEENLTGNILQLWKGF